MTTPEAAGSNIPQQPKLKQLLDHCFELSRIDEGDIIPVGGNKLSGKMTIGVRADFETLETFFAAVHKYAEEADKEKIRAVIAKEGVEISEELFAELLAFTRVWAEQFPANPKADVEREKLYSDKRGQIAISEIVRAGVARCAEIAAMAQAYLQREGVSSTYFTGEVLWAKTQEFGEAHSFIVIRSEGKVWIYDPMNPVRASGKVFPGIYSAPVNFDQEISAGTKKFVTAKNILTGREAFYGVGNHRNVSENDIV